MLQYMQQSDTAATYPAQSKFWRAPGRVGAEGFVKPSYYFHSGLAASWYCGLYLHLLILKDWLGGLAGSWQGHGGKAIEPAVWYLGAGDRNGEQWGHREPFSLTFYFAHSSNLQIFIECQLYVFLVLAKQCWIREQGPSFRTLTSWWEKTENELSIYNVIVSALKKKARKCD